MPTRPEHGPRRSPGRGNATDERDATGREGATGERDASGEPARVERARALVLRYGWNATTYQIINPGIDHWFSRSADAVVGFVRRHGVRVVAGAPACDRNRLADVVAEFERDARANSDRICYFGAEARLEGHVRGNPAYASVLLGAQPVWHPLSWNGMVARHASVRAQLNRARNKGVLVHEWPAAVAAHDPRLRKVLSEWLATRGLPPLHFLVEPRALDRPFDRRAFVATQQGAVIGFLVASPIPTRNGWLVEQNVRGLAAPNGTTELMIDTAVRTVADEGADYITLGLAPLSRRMQTASRGNPLWLRAVLGSVRAMGRRFYNFDGLDAFKSKFRPDDWEPVYAIASARSFRPGMLYAIAEAFAGGSPLVAVARGIMRSHR